MDTRENEFVHDLKRIAQKWNELKEAMDALFIHHIEVQKKGVQDGRYNRVAHRELGASGGRIVVTGATTQTNI